MPRNHHPRPRHVLRALALATTLAVTACGSADARSDAAPDATRTIEVTMVDLAFEPSELTIEKGETVTFRFTNKGKVDHEAFIGDRDDQAEHAREMESDGGMHHGDGDDDAVAVAPGKTGTLTYTFDEAGATEIGCHEPGHYAAGMKIDVTVE